VGENHPRKGDDTSSRIEQVSEKPRFTILTGGQPMTSASPTYTFIADARHVIADLRARGRVALILGALLAAAGVLAGNQRAATGLLSRGSR
jgi:hypothetical protein